MRLRVMSWPIIIAAFVGGVGVSGVFGSWALTTGPSGYWIACDWWGMVASALLIVMSYPLATGREWARRILLLAVVLVGLALVGSSGFRAVAPMSFSDLSPEQVKVIGPWTRLGELSSFFIRLTLLIFGVLFLSHPDVVTSFRRQVGSPERV